MKGSICQRGDHMGQQGSDGPRRTGSRRVELINRRRVDESSHSDGGPSVKATTPTRWTIATPGYRRPTRVA